MTTPRCGLLFHFTHVDNLPAVLNAGALLSDSAVCAGKLLQHEAGDPAIKKRRRACPVTCGQRGVVADYVPFYFAARSPMMYKLWIGGVPSFTGDHRDLVYFVTDVGSVLEASLPFVISDRNAAVAIADFTTDVTVLGDLVLPSPKSQFVDWPLMNAQWWNDTPDDPDRMERRMAEFLVHDRAPLEVMLGIAASSEAQKTTVERLLEETGRSVRVESRPGWYYP